jgi:hypothetical protein
VCDVDSHRWYTYPTQIFLLETHVLLLNYMSTDPNFLLQLTEKLYTILCCPALSPSVCAVGSSCSFPRKHTILFMKTTPWRGISVDPSPVQRFLDLEVHSYANLASISKLLRICMSSTRTTEYTCNAPVYVWRMN